MVFRISFLILLLMTMLVPRAASGGQPGPAEPRYDPATTVEFYAVVLEIRDVPRGGAMHGIHLMVDTGKETIDVYLGPAEFMKLFDFVFAKGDRIDVTGSKVKFGGATVVLAREVRRQSQTVYLRDASGNPNWPAGS